MLQHVIKRKAKYDPPVKDELILAPQLVGKLPAVYFALVGAESIDLDGNSPIRTNISEINEPGGVSKVPNLILWME